MWLVNVGGGRGVCCVIFGGCLGWCNIGRWKFGVSVKILVEVCVFGGK